MIFTLVLHRDGGYINAAGQSFRDFMAGRLPALPGELPTLKDWSNHLNTIFPEVRCTLRKVNTSMFDGARLSDSECFEFHCLMILATKPYSLR